MSDMSVTVPTLILILPVAALFSWLYAVFVAQPLLRRYDRWVEQRMADSRFDSEQHDRDDFESRLP